MNDLLQFCKKNIGEVQLDRMNTPECFLPFSEHYFRIYSRVCELLNDVQKPNQMIIIGFLYKIKCHDLVVFSWFYEINNSYY